jgi:predicted acylesterase/phospholipase RssA
MRRIGLALSGGGFRASLYHLGLVRFLRDAGILPHVTHITSVSGGSILAAHMVLHWDRYNGSPQEFDAAASEMLAFVRLDVRNRILRRFPLMLPVRWLRRLLWRGNRRLMLTGLLEAHYERYLYGDTSLFELPERPQLHILATNLSEGCLCSFNRNGLLMQRRHPGGTFRFDRIHMGLATVPMAVTASSAFPGFFPPLELTSADVGASAGEFARQAFTDGGIFDNLGVRMFRCLERSWLGETPLSRTDFHDFEAVAAALQEAGKSSEESPLRRLAQVLETSGTGQEAIPGAIMERASKILPPPSGAGAAKAEHPLLPGLSDVLLHCHFQREPLLGRLRPVDSEAEALLHACRSHGRTLDAGDQLWLNRHLLEAAFRQATGHACFRRLHSGLDGVLVSDVGKPFEVMANVRAGGLIRTAMRATDILMDRVWQLEKETFEGTPGFVFAPMTDVVEPAEDPTAPHPEIQRQATNIRTDLDRFSPLEISSLVRHGYCIGRKACRARPDLFGADLPDNAPWDPVSAPGGAASGAPAPSGAGHPSRDPAPTTVESRTLQASAVRRIWSTLLDWRDWVSWVYVPLILPILILLPYFVHKVYHHSHVLDQLVVSIAQGSRDLDEMVRLLEDGPDSYWKGVSAESVDKLDEPDFKGFELLQDSRIIDLRAWKPGAARSDSWISAYRRLRVLKLSEAGGSNLFRFHILPTSPRVEVRFPEQRLEGRLRTSPEEGPNGQKTYAWEAGFDFQKIPPGDYVDLVVQYLVPGLLQTDGEGLTSIRLPIQTPTAELTMWVFMPQRKEYRDFRLLRYPTGQPEKVEGVKLVTEYLAKDYTILAFKLLALKPGFTYEVQWAYSK